MFHVDLPLTSRGDYQYREVELSRDMMTTEYWDGALVRTGVPSLQYLGLISGSRYRGTEPI